MPASGAPEAARPGSAADRLAAGARHLGVPLDPVQARRLLEFEQLLKRWNERFNLVSRRDVHRLLTRHVLDSLSAGPRLRGPAVLDFGTGPGLPGLPLAVAYPALHFTLVDRGQRKVRFVEHAVRTLGLTNVEVLCQDAGRLTRTFDTVVCRAVGPWQSVWPQVERLLAPAGQLLVLARSGAAAPEPRAARPVPAPRAAVARAAVPGPGAGAELVVVTRAEPERGP